jgi:hypothetical protein
MFGINDLKQHLDITGNNVECPVKGCDTYVPKQKKSFKTTTEFQCPTHQIFISPSTFEYQEERDNLLWFQTNDRLLFEDIKKVKRESRIARDNSEDAVSWNVFRFLDRENLLDKYLTNFSKTEVKEAELILWSYSPKEKTIWSWLNKARLEFGETISRGSEPDIIILTDKVLYFIEAKLNANNKTKPSNPSERKEYETGGNKHFEKVFRSDYHTIAIAEKRYELMRFWLLGTWIAKELKVDFELVSLLRNENEKTLEKEFSEHIKTKAGINYSRIDWEDIYVFIVSSSDSKPKEMMCNYFKNKTIGYRTGQLKRAFEINNKC